MGAAQKTAWARLEQPPLALIPERVHRGYCKSSYGGGCPADCIGSPQTAPLELVPARVHRVTVVEVLAPCLGELEDGLEERGVSPDDTYNQMIQWFGGSYRSAWETCNLA